MPLSVRVRVNGPRDLRDARKLQTAMRIETLTPAKGSVADPTPVVTTGAWPGTARCRRRPCRCCCPRRRPHRPGAQAASLDANAFFARLARALDDNPPATDDTPTTRPR